MSLKRQVVHGVSWSAGSMAFTTIAQFAQLLILARLLPPNTLGLMAMLLVVLNFSQQYADLGVSNAIIHKQGQSRETLSSLYWVNLIAGFILFLLILLGAPIIAAVFQEPHLTKPLYWTAINFIILPLGQQYRVLLQKEMRFKAIAITDCAAVAIGTFVSILLAANGYDIYAIVWGYLIISTIKSVSFAIWGFKTAKPIFRLQFGHVTEYLRFGMYQLGERTVFFANSNLDSLIIGRMLGAEALGFYMLAYNLAIVPILKINPVLTSVMFPAFSKMQGEDRKLKESYFKVIRYLSFVNFPILLGMAAAAPYAVPLVFGAQWSGSVTLVQLLALVGLMRVIGNPIGALLMAVGKVDMGFKWHVAMLVTAIPILSAGAYLFGIVGVASAYILYQFIYLVTNYSYLLRGLFGPCLLSFIGSFAPALAASAIMAASMAGAASLVTNQKTAGILMLQLVLGIVVYAGFSLSFVRKGLIGANLRSERKSA
ncbi:MOP flippase family protein [Paenibacillus sp. GYB003]|uniref:MOP flippase family protein n=1 Tax=Paenibacillus sp. GYB003 TaxID=2994392 RepID=UPI002F9656FF